MVMVADDGDVVIGVDTHKHAHTAAAVGSTGAVLDNITVGTNAKGYRHLLEFGRRHRAGLWAVEGRAASGSG